MRTVTLSVETPEKVTWPSSCPACGIQINETEGTTTDIKVKKALKATFASGTPKKIAVRLCPRCTSRVIRASKIGKFGWGLAGIIFLLAVFVHPPRNQLEWSGAGFGFWVGAILGWLGESRKKSVVGLQTTRVSKDTWHFRFRNHSFAYLFLTANQALAKKE